MVFHIRKQRAKNKHTEETAFCPLQKKKEQNIWLVIISDLMTNFPFQL